MFASERTECQSGKSWVLYKTQHVDMTKQG
jgi:hypothetical protein